MIINTKLIVATALTVLISTATEALAESQYDRVLAEIVTGNRTLKSKSLLTDAVKSENMTGLNLPNPEVSFAYQWGYPVESLDKIILDISQTFDFATLSGAKKNVAKSQNRVAASQFAEERLGIVSEVDALMTKAVYLFRLDNLYKEMGSHLELMLSEADKAVEARSMTAMDANMIRMDVANVKTEAKLNSIELNSVMTMLKGMANKENLHWIPAEYKPYALPSDFNEWSRTSLERNPSVKTASDNINAADAQIKLRKREGLPEFSVGYTSEMVKNDDHYGVSFGMTLPFWGNKGRVKAAKAARMAADAEADDIRYKTLVDMRMKYDKAKALMESDIEMRKLYSECDNRAQLKKLYESGNMSVHDYLTQITPQFDMAKQMLATDYAYQEALAALRGAAADY